MCRAMSWAIGALAGTMAVAGGQDGLIAHFDFSQGKGDVLVDRSGNGHDGRIVGASWVHDHGLGALRFTGKDSYVDLGRAPELKASGDFTFLAWIKLAPPAYPDSNTNWYLFDCEEYGKAGTMLRVDGAQAKLTYRSSRAGPTPHRFGRTKLEKGGTYLVGFVRQGTTGTLILDGIADGQLDVGGDPIYGPLPFSLSARGQSFGGLMYDVKLFDRALGTAEIIGEYWRLAGQLGKDTSRQGSLALDLHIYDDDREGLFEVDAFGALPLAEEERLSIELSRTDGALVDTHDATKIPASCVVDHSVDFSDLPPGRYAVAAKVTAGGKIRTEARKRFDWPSEALLLPGPDQHTVPPLAGPRKRTVVEARVEPAGGLTVSAPGLSLAIESSFSVPNAAAMALAVRGRPAAGMVTGDTSVRARNAHYLLERQVEAKPGRVVVRDTFTNLTDKPVGVILSHRAVGSLHSQMIAGYEVTPGVERRIRTNPTTFFRTGAHGIGLVALDDVLIVQGRGCVEEEGVSIGSKEFAIASRGSYTTEWAVYVAGDGDYYDLINDLRSDEGRNSTTVAGSWCTFPGSLRRRSPDVIPGRDFFERRNVAYASLACLSYCTDDPSFSLEGIEFMEYPRERAAVRRTIDAIRRVWPQARPMFHIAPNLYATGTPDDLWPDSRIISADGEQTMYAYNYQPGNYFTKERLDQGWRWWSYYPALDNSYGKALLNSVDTMMDEMGASGVFVDGCLWSYGGEYSYDRFDGHTADIDPTSGAITRLKTAIPLKQQHAMVAYGRRVMAKGGVFVANNVYPTRTLAREPFIFDKEISEGPEMHLLPTPCTLGNPSVIKSESDVHRDVLSKLAWGNLYFYYGEPTQLKHESAPARMYPITVDEIRAGYVKGKERIVTARSGAVGWHDDRSLHAVYRYDNRGRRVRHNFMTTVDSSSSRTQLALAKGEMAIVERLPITVASSTAVNLHVLSVDETEATVLLNGDGDIVLNRKRLSLHGRQKVTVDLTQ
jgi:hypothetical protein